MIIFVNLYLDTISWLNSQYILDCMLFREAAKLGKHLVLA